MTNATVETREMTEESKKKWKEFIGFCNEHRFLEIHYMPIKNGDPLSWGTVKRKFNRKKYREQKGSVTSESAMFTEWSDFIEFCKGNSGTVEILHVQDGLPIHADAIFRENGETSI
jgi:hypothetical protein